MPDKQTGSSTAARLARRCLIEPQQVEDAYPCTSLQAALVAASLQDLGSYVSRFIFDVSSVQPGPEAVKAAFELVYNHTAILRTRIIENNGLFLQIVVAEPLPWIEANDLQRYLAQDKQQAVALGKPLARLAWIRENGGKAYMVWSLHHCQYDEWSFQLMLQDVNGAVRQAQEPKQLPYRPPFSKFIKALDHIDLSASHTFWKENLRHVSKCGAMCPKKPDEETFRTLQRLEKTTPVGFPTESVYQPAALAVAAWSLLLSHLAGSSDVLFGQVLSGRTSDLNGIQDICGPTLATVPWYSNVPSDQTVQSFLDRLQNQRLQLLPFEQTGLMEYRKLEGAAGFETLLSVRASHDVAPYGDAEGALQPEKPDANDLNHPCAVFLEVELKGNECKLKVSYDDRYINTPHLSDAMDCFVTLMESLPRSLYTKLGSILELSKLPSSLQRNDINVTPTPARSSTEEVDLAVDAQTIKKLQKLVVDVAGVRDVKSIRPEATLMQLGIDSLKSVMLSRHISKAFDVSVPFKNITGPGRTVSSIGRSIEKVLQSKDRNVKDESRLELLELAEKQMWMLKRAQPKSQRFPATRDGNAAILLTGATGYLGVEILRHCLAASSDLLVLLVRCRIASEGMERIRKAARTAVWSDAEIDLLKQRVTIWPSDLTQERLGLASENWKQLSDWSFRAIIHNGAKVDFLQNYVDLEDANVRSTAILLDQHLRMPTKPAFVYVTGGRPCPLTPDGLEETASKLASAGGYAQTKFVSEVLVHRVKKLYTDAGVSVSTSIVHPGAIIGRASNGVANTDDFVWRYVASSWRMGCYVPAVPTKREWINLTPVDLVAVEVVNRAMKNAQETEDVERCLVRSGLPVSQFWATVVDVLHKRSLSALDAVSEWEWLQEFKDDINTAGPTQPLFALSQLLLEGHLPGIGGRAPHIDSKTGAIPDTSDVEAALRSNVEYLWSREFFSRDGVADGVFVRSKA